MKRHILSAFAGLMALTSGINTHAVDVRADYLVGTLVASGVSGGGVAMAFNKMKDKGLSTNVAALCTLGVGAIACYIRCSLMQGIPHMPYSPLGAAAALAAFFATV